MMRNVIRSFAVALLIGGLVLSSTLPAGAWPAYPAGDFITGGGWFIIQSEGAVYAIPGTRANFGWHGGVKNGNFWGNGNYVDHGTGVHVRSLSVTGYLRIGTDGTDAKGRRAGTRDICGTARVEGFSDVWYRVRMKDAGEPGRSDQFGISLWASPAGGLLYLAWGTLNGGGNIQLHGPNPSTFGPTTSTCPPDAFSFG